MTDGSERSEMERKSQSGDGQGSSLAEPYQQRQKWRDGEACKPLQYSMNGTTILRARCYATIAIGLQGLLRVGNPQSDVIVYDAHNPTINILKSCKFSSSPFSRYMIML